MFRESSWNISIVVVFFYIHIMGLWAFFTPFDVGYLPLSIFFFFWFGLSSSFYYHRGVCHRGYEMVLPLHLFFLLGGLIGLSGSPIKWSIIHRYHHRHPEQDKDTHSPKHGFWWAYCLWYMKLDREKIKEQAHITKDLEKFWFLKAAEHRLAEIVPHALMAGFVYWQWGFAGYLWGFMLPMALSYQCHWMLIASLCHLPQLGYRSYDTNDWSRNIWWLGLMSFGESFHNNHHRFGSSIRVGRKWHEIDISQYTAYILEKLHLIKNVDRT